MRAWMIGLMLTAGLALGAQTVSEHAPSTPAAPLTLEQCIAAAQGESPIEASATLSLESASHTAEAAKAPYYPSLAFSLGASRWQRRIFLPNGLSFPGKPVPTLVGPTDDYTFALSAAYTLFDGGERKAQLGAARARQKMSGAEAARVRQDLSLTVAQAYFALASAQARRDVAAQSLKRSEDHLALAQARKEAGAVPLADVKRAEADAADARLTLVRADDAVRVSRGRLATAMGLNASTPLDLAPPVDPPKAPEESELARAQATALQNRPAIHAAEQGVEAARRGVDATRSAFAPKVSAAASYGREDASWYPQDKTWLVGVTVSVPLFTGFSRVQNLAKAKVDLSKAETDARQTALAIQEQVWDAYSGLQAAYEAIQTAEALVASARESERLARDRYEVGAGTITDLLDAETALAKAETSQVTAQWEYRAARVQFRWSSGDLP